MFKRLLRWLHFLWNPILRRDYKTPAYYNNYYILFRGFDELMRRQREMREATSLSTNTIEVIEGVPRRKRWWAE